MHLSTKLWILTSALFVVGVILTLSGGQALVPLFYVVGAAIGFNAWAHEKK